MSASPGDNNLTPWADMLVEVAHPDDETTFGEARTSVPCTYCIRNGDTTQYPSHEVMVIRHWKANTPNEPDAGWWAWYCPDHFAATAPWMSSLLAPEHS